MKKIKKFLKGIRGKQLLVSALAVMVIASGYYRFAMGGKEVMTVSNEVLPIEEGQIVTENVEPTQDSNYFARARYERDCARSEAVELLTVSTVEGEQSTAIDEKIALYAQNANSETAIENLVLAKGFDDCVAFVDENGVSVVVKSEKLDSASVAKIKDIIIGQTGVMATKIKISCKN